MPQEVVDVVTLFYGEHKSGRETADYLQITYSACKRRLNQAREICGLVRKGRDSYKPTAKEISVGAAKIRAKNEGLLPRWEYLH